MTGRGLEDLSGEVLVVVTLPVFALLLKLLYGPVGGYGARLSECLLFAMNFQSAIFVLGALAGWLPDHPLLEGAELLYVVLYIWLGINRIQPMPAQLAMAHQVWSNAPVIHALQECSNNLAQHLSIR